MPIIVPPTTSTERRTRSGIGDLRLTGSYTFSAAPVGLSLSAQVKLPTASAAKGIGTGKTDVAVGGELFKQVGRVTPYLDLAYTMSGSPAGYRLDDSLSGQIGWCNSAGAFADILATPTRRRSARRSTTSNRGPKAPTWASPARRRWRCTAAPACRAARRTSPPRYESECASNESMRAAATIGTSECISRGGYFRQRQGGVGNDGNRRVADEQIIPSPQQSIGGAELSAGAR